MKIVAIISARLGSSRLQGKVLRPITGIPMIEHMVRRLSQCRTLSHVMVGVTDNPNDQLLIDFLCQKGISVGVGSEDDVLGRYYKIAKEQKADVIVRLTGDCPLIDPEITDAVVLRHLSTKSVDVTSNVVNRTFPRGMDTEVLSWACLDRLNREATEKLYREHVTNYVYDHPEKFRIESYEGKEDWSDLRLCVDTEDDYQVVASVYDGVFSQKPQFKLVDVIAYLDAHPEIAKINSHVQQSKIFKVRKKA